MGSFAALTVEFALIIAVAAVCGGVLGWVLGRRRAAEALTPASRPALERPDADAPPAAATGLSDRAAPAAPHADAPEDADEQPTQVLEAITEPEPEEPDTPAGAEQPAARDARDARTPEGAAAAPAADPDPEIAARVAELEQLIAAKDREISMLEAGAVAAWDKTVPTLEWQIDSLREENSEMAAMLRKALDELESQSVQAEALRSALSERDRRLAGLDTRSAS